MRCFDDGSIQMFVKNISIPTLDFRMMGGKVAKCTDAILDTSSIYLEDSDHGNTLIITAEELKEIMDHHIEIHNNEHNYNFDCYHIDTINGKKRVILTGDIIESKDLIMNSEKYLAWKSKRVTNDISTINNIINNIVNNKLLAENVSYDYFHASIYRPLFTIIDSGLYSYQDERSNAELGDFTAYIISKKDSITLDYLSYDNNYSKIRIHRKDRDIIIDNCNNVKDGLSAAIEYIDNNGKNISIIMDMDGCTKE